MGKHYDWKPVFLAALREVPVLTWAATQAGIQRTTVYRAKESDKDFAADMEDAMEDGIDKAEQELFRRAVTGFEEPVIDKGALAYRHVYTTDENGELQARVMLDEQGQPVPLTVRKHSDGLLSLLLKGRRKKIYAERTEITGGDGGPVVVDSALRAARVAQLLAVAQQRKANENTFDDLA